MKTDKIDASIPLTIQALILAREDGKPQGTITCPQCKGTITYVTAYNRHTWGKCKTENCISWVE